MIGVNIALNFISFIGFMLNYNDKIDPLLNYVVEENVFKLGGVMLRALRQ